MAATQNGPHSAERLAATVRSFAKSFRRVRDNEPYPSDSNVPAFHIRFFLRKTTSRGILAWHQWHFLVRVFP
jgi:hypothetical protein